MLPGRVSAVQIGLFRTAVTVETEAGLRCGLAATLSNPELEHSRNPAVRWAGRLHQCAAAELVALIHSDSYTEVAVGLATLNALLPPPPAGWAELNAADYILQHAAGGAVAVVGHFPFIEQLRARLRQLWVLELNPRPGDLPASAAPEIIPQADLVAITASTLVNKTFEGLLALRRPGARVLLLGPSTPLSPVLFDYGMDVLAGAVVEDAAAVMTGLAQAASVHQLAASGAIRLVTMARAG